MNIEICVVEVDGAHYSDSARAEAGRAFPGGDWRPWPLPDEHAVVRTVSASACYGLPNWAYSFWREVK